MSRLPPPVLAGHSRDTPFRNHVGIARRFAVDISVASDKIGPPLGPSKGNAKEGVSMNLFRRHLVILLSFLICTTPVFSAPDGTRAGEISAMIPAATLNSSPAKTKEELDWNDLLKTEHSGRVRASLADGSILSLGSDSELRIVKHDATSQQTSLEMNFGKVRSQVIKITAPGGKFEVKTPNAVIGVIGTDFYVAYEGNTTTVICYTGQVIATPLGNAQVQSNNGQGASNNSVTVNPGQMVEITTNIPPDGFHVSQVPPSQAQNGILSTNVTEKEPKAPGPSHTGVWVALGFAAAAGLAYGLTYGNNGNAQTNPTNPKCIPGTANCH